MEVGKAIKQRMKAAERSKQDGNCKTLYVTATMRITDDLEE